MAFSVGSCKGCKERRLLLKSAATYVKHVTVQKFAPKGKK